MKNFLFAGTLFALLCLISFSFALCGNNILDSDEQCDGNNFGLMTCEKMDKGYIGGQLTCNLDCTLETISCYSDVNSIESDNNLPEEISDFRCGDGVRQNNEQCDKNDFGGKTCESIGYSLGNLICNSRCIIDLKNCKNQNETISAYDENTVLSQTSNSPKNEIDETSTNTGTLIVAILVVTILIFFGISKLNAQKDEKERKEIISKIRNK